MFANVTNVNQQNAMKLNNTMTGNEIGSWLYIGIIIAFLVLIFGTFGNMMTILAYRRNKKLQNTFNLLVANLCGIELVFSTLVMSLIIPGMILEKDPYNESFCIAVGYFYYSLHASALFNIVVIAINRYIGVIHANEYSRCYRSRNVKICIACSWLASPILHLPLLYDGISWSPEVLRCTVDLENSPNGIRKYNLALNLVFQAVPMIILIYAYSMIMRKVRVLNNKLEKHRAVLRLTSNGSAKTSSCRGFGKGPNLSNKETTGTPQDSVRRSEDPKQIPQLKVTGINKMKKEKLNVEKSEESEIDDVLETNSSNVFEKNSENKKTNKSRKVKRDRATTKSRQNRKIVKHRLEKQLAYSSFLICVTFALCMLPTSLLYVIQVVRGSQESASTNFVAGTITWLHTVINPIIYGYSNSQYRLEYSKMIRSLFKGRIDG